MMKRYLVLALLTLVTVLAGCGDTGGDSPTPTTRSVTGLVTTEAGVPLSGVTVTAHGMSTSTDAQGNFSLSGLSTPSDRLVLELFKIGYFDNIVGKNPTSGTMYVEVVMMEKKLIGTINSGTGGQLNLEAGTGSTVNFQGGSFADGSGIPVSGSVNVYANTISPDQPNFGNAMPGGDFSATDSTGQNGVLTSFGALNIGVEDLGGNNLEVTVPYDICLDIPASMSTAALSLTTMPVWQMRNGSWQEVATATKVGNQFCFQYTGTGSINCDLFGRTALLEGRACSVGAGIPEAEFTVNGQIKTYSDSQGNFSAIVPSGNLTITTPSGQQITATADAGAVVPVEYGMCNVTARSFGFCADNYPQDACSLLISGYSSTTVPGSTGWQVAPAGSCTSLGFSSDMASQFYWYDYGYTGTSMGAPVACVIYGEYNF